MNSLASLLASAALAAFLLANNTAEARTLTRIQCSPRQFNYQPSKDDMIPKATCTCIRISRWIPRMRAHCNVFWFAFSQEPFSLDKSIDEIDFSRSIIVSVHYLSLKGLDHMKVITMEEVSLNTVDKDAFSKLRDLRSLSLARNHLRELDKTTFVHNERLHRLSLRGNVYLGMPMLQSKSIEVLDVADCSIDHLAQEDFVGLPALSQLHLEENFLRSLDPSAMLPLTKLSRLFLQQNLFDSIPSKAIKVLPSLLELRLDGNRGVEGMLSPLEAPRLQLLSASDCNLESVQPNLLVGAPNLRYLNVSKNRLHTLSLAGEAHLILLDASNNSLTCDCTLRESCIWARDHVAEARVFCGDPPLHWDNGSFEQLSCNEVLTSTGSTSGDGQTAALALWISLSLLAVLAALGGGLIIVYRQELLARYYYSEDHDVTSRGIDNVPIEENHGNEDDSIASPPNS